MKKSIIMLLFTLLLLACADNKPRYVIGVSQCSEDIWREKQNAELRMGAYFHDNVTLRFAAAYDSDERQVQQIDSLVATGIDLLIVAPNQVQTISPAIDRAYDKGIPVIVFERKTSSQKHTAFISADNYEMGHVMGQHVASSLHGKGRVVEIMGLRGSSPAIERHNGFADALKNYPDIEIVATLQGDWTEESGYKSMHQWLSEAGQPNSQPIDYVFGQNDRMAMGARKAMLEATTSLSHGKGTGGVAPKYCGIDGLPGEGGGIRLVRDSVLDATYIYPTHGDRLVQLAVDILDGKPYEKESLLMSALVTSDNARVLLMQSEEIIRQSRYLDLLHEKADGYLHELDTQRVVSWMAAGVIFLLLLTIVLLYINHLKNISIQRERVVNTLWNMETTPTPIEQHIPVSVTASVDGTVPAGESILTGEHVVADEPVPEGTPIPAEPTPSPSSSTERVADSQEDVRSPDVSLFITRFKEVVEARMADSEVSVEDLAADMNLSRVQLYRKVKSITDSSPVELLRNARLNRAYQMLLTTDKSVSEVAYAVGFTAPSYFTKCFKEEYGMVPGDVRK